MLRVYLTMVDQPPPTTPELLGKAVQLMARMERAVSRAEAALRDAKKAQQQEAQDQQPDKPASSR
jgi:hypothetical protein